MLQGGCARAEALSSGDRTMISSNHMALTRQWSG